MSWGALEKAVDTAAELAAHDSFQEHGYGRTEQAAWVAVTQKLAKTDPFMWEMLPSTMPKRFRTEYARHCERLSLEQAAVRGVSA
jgi:hypothetical protein